MRISPDVSSNSNSGFDAVNDKLAPHRRVYGGKSLLSYNGPLDILENQSEFDDLVIHWNEMFDLGVNSAGQSNVV